MTTAYEMVHGEGVGRPTGILERINQEMKHDWLPAYSKLRPCILRWHKGGLEQLYVCWESRQAKWKKIPKKEEK